MSDEQQHNGRGKYSLTGLIGILIVILLIVAVGIWAIVTATVPDSRRLVYTEKEDGTLEVSEIRNTYKDGWFCRKSLTVPEKVGGKTVTSIAHIDSRKLQKIVLPDSVTTIGTEAFSGDSSLKEVYLGNSVRTIGDSAWKRCSSLHTISFPNTVETVGSKVFDGAPIEYTQSGGLNYIGNAENPYLVLMGAGDTFVAEATVHENTKLAARSCFEATKSDKNQQSGNQIGKIDTGNLEILPERMFMGCDRLEEVVTAAKELGANCFDKCTGLVSIEVSDSLERLKSRCLAETGLTALTLPAGVTSFAEDAVQGSASLATLQVNSENSKYQSAHNILYTKDLKDIVAVAEGMPEATLLPGLKLSSGSKNCLDKLSACGNLTSISIEGGEITFTQGSSSNQHTFTYFAEAGILYKRDSYTKSGDSVQEVTLHTVPRMIENITLSNDLTALSADAFSACTKLKSISIEGEETLTFTQGTSSNQHIYTYFAEKDILYRTDKYTKNDEQIEETEIFAVPRAIESITLSDELTSLSADAFSACTELKSISVGGEGTITVTQGASSNQHIYTYFAEEGILYRTDKYTKDSEQVEETEIFAVPRAIENVVLSDKVTSIAAKAFSACKELKSVVISGNITKIGAGAFSGCEKLTQATFRETDGWKVAKDAKGTGAQALTDLGDTAKAAEHLTGDYAGHIWTRE